LLVTYLIGCFSCNIDNDASILSYTIDPTQQQLGFYWKDENGQILKSIERLKTYVAQKGFELVFAMNGGMFQSDHAPKGLYIENNRMLSFLDIGKGDGNFYLQPNGVFYLTRDNKAVICKTEDFRMNSQIKFATQSGPMLLINGQMHTAFKKVSTNLNIRNGVGILPDNKVVFAMSKREINFYDFAEYFQKRGCKYALYLDGLVSRTYLPEKNWIQLDGEFGVMIGVTKVVEN